MSIGYWVKCDGCGHTEDSWPEGMSSFHGWARITGQDGQVDFCENCASKMVNALKESKL